MALRVGTSGWQYRDWRDEVYHGAPVATWLERYAEVFPTVEVDSSFYRLPERHTVRAWASSTPDDFRFSLKVSRYLTHVRRLRDPAEPVGRFLDRACVLGPKLGAALLQLPPDLPVAVDRLEDLLDRWPAEVRLAVEPRHPTWFCDEVHDLLRDASVALARTDRLGRPQEPAWRTADWCYVRLHEGTAHPRPSYGDRALRSWADRVRRSWGSDADGYVYFNNDEGACAPRDARRFTRIARRTGSAVVTHDPSTSADAERPDR